MKMDKKKIEALKKIQEFRDKRISPDFEALEQEGFEKGFLRAMVKERIINNIGTIFHITKKGEGILSTCKLIEISEKSKNKQKIIFDSNIYDLIADGSLNINMLSERKEDFEFYITHIQTDEISKCPIEDKRARLFLFTTKVSPLVVPTESVIWGVSRFGESKFGDGKIIEEIRKENLKHTKDALIGEVAIKNKFILVTEDNRLKNKVNSLEGKAINLNEFKEMLK